MYLGLRPVLRPLLFSDHYCVHVLFQCPLMKNANGGTLFEHDLYV